ncbi:MAG: hypothetical protein CMF72_24715 [Mameliella sp.]|nr:hypothetical protein [Mameliella sp.]
MTRRAQFLPSDVLRLEVETTPPGLVNLLQNPDGALGGWGWVTPVIGSSMFRTVNPFTGTSLRYLAVGGTPNRFESELIPADAGQYVAASWLSRSSTGGAAGPYRFYFEWIDSEGIVTAAPYGAYYVSEVGTRRYLATEEVPAGTVQLRLVGEVNANYGSGPIDPFEGWTWTFDEVCVAAAESASELVDLQFLPPAYYVDVLGSTNSIEVQREELNVGFLTAVIINSALDPSEAASDLVPGRRIRLMARIPETGFDDLDYGEGLYGGEATEWSPIFTGQIEKPTVKYDLLHKDPAKRSRITITAVDPATALSRVGRLEGVATIDELPYVLEGAGIPWNVNGSGNQVPDAVVVSTNENASAVDQVAITRDTALGYAWVDRFGILQAWDAAELVENLPANPGGVTALDEADYGRDVDVDYDTDVCINAVKVVVLQINVTGETNEITFGPYRDEPSIRANGLHPATYTVHGIGDADVPTYAAAILAANATPRRRINSVSVPVRERRALPKTLIDVGELLTVSNERAGIDELHRVAAVRHSISATNKGTRWSVGLSFVGTDRVAAATEAPSLAPGGGRTLAELYRPVGEVTMWFGAAGDVPDGWLILDGDTFDGEVYPKLAELLGGTTLPNLIDRFPIGAGTKELGTAGGDPTKVITQDRAFNTAVTSGGQVRVELVESPLDVMPPWRAVHFIIRAV